MHLTSYHQKYRCALRILKKHKNVNLSMKKTSDIYKSGVVQMRNELFDILAAFTDWYTALFESQKLSPKISPKNIKKRHYGDEGDE